MSTFFLKSRHCAKCLYGYNVDFSYDEGEGDIYMYPYNVEASGKNVISVPVQCRKV